MRTYKLRDAPGGASQITLPRELSILVPADSHFQPELVEDGILFRLVKEPEPEGLPEWVRRERE